MKKDIAFLFRIFRRERKHNLVLGLLSIGLNICGALLEGMAYYFMIYALSALVGAGAKGGAFFTFFSVKLGVKAQHLFYFAIFLGITSQILKSTLCYLASCLTGRLLKRMQIALQSEVFSHLFRLSYPCVNRYKMGELLEYVRSPSNFLRPLLESCNLFFVALCIILVSLILLIFISLPLTLFTFFLFFCAFFIHRYFSKRSKKQSYALAKQAASVSAHATQSLNGLKVIHVYNHQKSILNKTYQLLEKAAENSKKLIIGNAAVLAMSEIAGILTVGLILLVGPFFVSQGHGALVPTLLGFVTIAYRLSGKVQGAMSSAMIMGSYMGEVGQVRQILDPSDKEFIREKGSKEIHFNKEIAFKNVRFVYPNQQSGAIDKISCTFKKGEVTAISGRSGAGKSTLIDLLLGLYHPTKGQIFLDHQDLNELDLSAYREKIGVVMQESTIFSGTVEDNIRLGNPHATPGHLQRAAKMAHADLFITALHQGYQTVLGEKGYRLSGGEKQRIALARALVRDPDILILDEATSNLDSRSESYIQEALAELKGKKTIIIVAHRLSTVVHADIIYVMEKGSIVEKGTHQTLIDMRGVYANFWKRQTSFTKEVTV